MAVPISLNAAPLAFTSDLARCVDGGGGAPVANPYIWALPPVAEGVEEIAEVKIIETMI